MDEENNVKEAVAGPAESGNDTTRTEDATVGAENNVLAEPAPVTLPTFKTPSFVIPTKKKVKSSTETEDVFKAPEKLAVKPSSATYSNQNDKPAEKEVAVKSGAEDISEKGAPKPKDEIPKSQTAQPDLSPAEQLKQAQAAVPYKEPAWSSICEEKFSFEIIKNGAILNNVDLTSRSFHVVGRLPSCNIPMEHPSLSRYHAVIQYSNGSKEDFPKGWYLFDLDSTHGTWINKHKVPPKKYHRIHVDYVLKFGGSTRLFIVQGPDSDREEESELSVEEMKAQRDTQKKQTELIRQAEIEEAERKAELLKKSEESKGCSWGIGEDVQEEEEENVENPFAAIETENESLYIHDPKKALNGYFEREGLELPEYEIHEASYGKWKCSIELPIDAPNGESIVAMVDVTGKKREAVVACALEACRILDRHGELRKAAQESRKRKQKNWEEDDFYDSDDDTYLDRTGAIEKKREMRKIKIGKKDNSMETYDSLMEKHAHIIAEIEDIEGKLEHAKAQAAAMDSDDVDALDAYMSAIKSGMMDTKTKMKFKRQLMELKQEEQKVRKLVNIAKPASLPERKSVSITEMKKPSLAIGVGKMKGPVGGKVVRKVVLNVKQDAEKETEEDEVEEDDADDSVVMETENSAETRTVADAQENCESLTEEKSNQVVNTAVPNEKKLKKESVKPSEPKMKGPSLPSPVSDSRKKGSSVTLPSSESRMKGPNMPLAAVLEKLQEEADKSEEQSSEADDKHSDNSDIRRKRNRKDISDKSTKKSKKSTGYKDDDPDYAVWLPPQNQSGDGKTHLNEKLGY